MSDFSPSDLRVLLTSPIEHDPAKAVSPFFLADPTEIVYCVFFRTIELRAAFLEKMRAIPREPSLAVGEEAEREAVLRQLVQEYETAQTSGDAASALFTVTRWTTGLLRKPLHSYSLKEGLGPFRTGCIFSFDAQESDSLLFNLSLARKTLEAEQSRVMGFIVPKGLV